MPVLFLLFVASGAAALIYEIVWFQLLELFIGSSSISMGVLLGTFMGGMCLGSLLLPRLSSPRRHPLRVYAVLESTVGLCGLLLLIVLPWVGRIYTAWGGGGFTGFALRAVVAAVCLLPPTLAMGGTLPAVSRAVETTRDGVAKLGLFYAGNLSGAVFGSLFAGFYLLRVHDTRVATFAAVAFNAAAAAVAIRHARSHPISAPEDRPTHLDSSDGAPAAARPLVVYGAIAISGFCALAAEVIWTRLLALLFGATVYAFSLILAVFLFGLGIGSTVGAELARRLEPRRAFGWSQWLLVAATAWAAHELSVSLPYWPINPAISVDIWLDFRLDVLRTAWAVLPAAVLWGASFPLAVACAARAGQDPGRLVGAVYAANTIGAVAGALFTSLLLVAWLGSQHTQQLMMGIAAVSALLLLPPIGDGVGREDTVGPTAPGPRPPGALSPPPTIRWPRLAGTAAALAATAFLIAKVPPVPGMLVAYGRFAAALLGQAGDILYVGEGLQSSVAVSRLPNGKLGYHNAGKIQASSAPEDMRLQRMLGHMTTLVPGHARSVLVIGCGAGVTAGAVSIDPSVERVTIAEIEPLVPRVVSRYFGEQNHHVVDNPKVRIRIDDARHFLLTSRETFDAITSDPLDPWVKGAASLYTREFFEAARDHLSPDGVMTLFVQLYDSSPVSIKSEIATFFDVFPDAIIAGNTFRGIGYDTVLMGRANPLRIDLGAVDAKLRRADYAPLSASLREIGVGSAVDLFATYAGRATDLRPWTRDALINHDRDLRLQYLAGLGLNTNESDAVYGEILKYRRFPADLFAGPEAELDALRNRIENR
jgi:spermidine synthase